MKNFLKAGYLFLAALILMFTVMPQNAGATAKESNEDSDKLYEDLNNLDEETLAMYEVMDNYLLKSKDGSIKLDLETARLDGVDPVILDMMSTVNGMGGIQAQDGEISAYDFAFPIGNYGRYCGKGNKGGTAIDELDEACQRHDGCFLGFNNTTSINKKCNQIFVGELMVIVQATYPISKKGSYARSALYLFKKYI